MSYSFPIEILLISYSGLTHVPFIPIHSSSFHFQSFAKKVINKGIVNKVLGLDGEPIPIQFLFISY